MRHYLATERRVPTGGKPESGNMDGVVVSAEFVRDYVAIESRRVLLVHNGSIEEMRKTKAGVITIKSTDADKTACRIVRFTPWFPETGGA